MILDGSHNKGRLVTFHQQPDIPQLTLSRKLKMTQNAPVHVLMASVLSGENDKNGGGSSSDGGHLQERQWELNPRLQRDYIAQRTKAGATSKEERHKPLHLWSGVNDTEYALVCCCEDREEGPQQDYELSSVPYSSSSTPGKSWRSEFPLVGGGALDVEQEVRFVGILANDCHTMATRVLALAILERTLDIHLWELEEANKRKRPHPVGEALDPQQEEKEDEDAEEEQEDEGDDEKDDDTDSGGKRKSKRLQKRQPKYKRTKRKAEAQKESLSSTSSPSNDKQETNFKFDYEKWSRLEQFFAAGGLRILNRWLMEASDDESVPPPLPPPPSSHPASRGRSRSSSSKTAQATTKPSEFRPLILPILIFLERIPFDKKLVLDSKINKQIRNIEKQVIGIMQARAQGKHKLEDLQNWTMTPNSSQTEALDSIKEAVQNVKKTWGEKAKKEKGNFGNPFEALTAMLRERMEEVTAFEQGSAPRPAWMERPEEKKESTAKKSRSELAAKERLVELEIQKGLDEDLKQRLREAERRHREHLDHLRAAMRKKQETSAPSLNSDAKKKSGGREVQWKDGMKSKSVRNRKELEEVFVFNKHAPANKDMVDFVEEEVREDGTPPETITTTSTSPDDPQTENSRVSDMETDDLIDFSLV